MSYLNEILVRRQETGFRSQEHPTCLSSAGHLVNLKASPGPTEHRLEPKLEVPNIEPVSEPSEASTVILRNDAKRPTWELQASGSRSS